MTIEGFEHQEDDQDDGTQQYSGEDPPKRASYGRSILSKEAQLADLFALRVPQI